MLVFQYCSLSILGFSTLTWTILALYGPRIQTQSFQKWIFNFTILILILPKEKAIMMFVHKVNIESILFISKFLENLLLTVLMTGFLLPQRSIKKHQLFKLWYNAATNGQNGSLCFLLPRKIKLLQTETYQ